VLQRESLYSWATIEKRKSLLHGREEKEVLILAVREKKANCNTSIRRFKYQFSEKRERGVELKLRKEREGNVRWHRSKGAFHAWWRRRDFPPQRKRQKKGRIPRPFGKESRC